MSSDRLELKCANCGSKKFKLPSNPNPSDIVVCAGCGASSRYDVLQRAALSEAKKHIENAFKDIVKKR